MTFQLSTGTDQNPPDYILQSINTKVFKNVDGLMYNMMISARHLEQKKYPKKILRPILTKNNAAYHKDDEGNYWRVYPYFKNTRTFTTIPTPSVAFEIAFSYGEYIRYLDDLNISKLVTTIPDFHNTPLRYQQLNEVIKVADKTCLKSAAKVIGQIIELDYLLKVYPTIKTHLRPVHYDTKISNVLLDAISNEGVAIIDLDTLMPGMLPFDFGDLVRTGAATSDENEADLSAVQINPELLKVLTSGFLDGIKDAIKPTEKKNLINGVALIIYEQAIRFLIDYLQNNWYYSIQYPDQNLTRTKNQMILLHDLLNQ